MNAGRMRDRIEFKKEKSITNDNGFPELVYVPYRTVWAKVNNLFGAEFWAAEAVQKENTVVFEIRYDKDIENVNTKETVIEFRGRTFNIIHIDNVLYKNEKLLVKGIELE